MTAPQHFPVNPSRRQFLSTLALGALSARGQEPTKPFPPTRVITKGPGFHWFAYYDKLQFSPNNRFVLSNRASFEGRSPTGDDVIEVGMIDLQENDKWIPLGKSNAWCWQAIFSIGTSSTSAAGRQGSTS